MSTGRKAASVAALALLLLGSWQLACAGWIHAKAFVAQRLIAASWARADAQGEARRPWPGADMRPIARLRIAAKGVDLYVLDAATPRALAFGPARVGGTAAPGSWGNSVIVAHRDTHFRFLREVAIDDVVEVEAAGGARVRYRVSEVSIVDQSDARALDAGDEARLTLVTCYPFDAVRPGTRLRYVVVAGRLA